MVNPTARAELLDGPWVQGAVCSRSGVAREVRDYSLMTNTTIWSGGGLEPWIRLAREQGFV